MYVRLTSPEVASRGECIGCMQRLDRMLRYLGAAAHRAKPQRMSLAWVHTWAVVRDPLPLFADNDGRSVTELVAAYVRAMTPPCGPSRSMSTPVDAL